MSDNFPKENLEDLDYRLSRAREESLLNKQTSYMSVTEKTHSYSMAIRIGTELVAALVVGVGIGYFLDYLFGTKPWFLVLFFFLGAGAGILNVYRAAKGLGMTLGYEEPSGGVTSLVKHQKTLTKD